MISPRGHKIWPIYLSIGIIAVSFAPMIADAKIPGTTYCYKDICHRVKTIAETALDRGTPHHVMASYYDVPERDKFNPAGLTSSGEAFRAEDSDTAASPIYPNGTKLLVYAQATGGAAVVRVNNTGPYWTGRLLDLSRGAAEKLGFAHLGLAQVVTVVLAPPTDTEARYDLNRSYQPVPGYLGEFASLAQAKAAWTARPEAARTTDSTTPADAAETPAESPVVIIGSKASAGKASTPRATTATKVVLKPVRLRRPLILAANAKRRTKVASKRSSSRNGS